MSALREAEARVYAAAYKVAFKDARKKNDDRLDAQRKAEHAGANAVSSFRRTQ
jgi:hypothetical protein